MSYLLDTNAWIRYLKQPGSAIHARLQTLSPISVVTCSIVKAELLHCAEKYGNRNRRVATVLRTLAPFPSIAFDDDAATHYASIRHSLEIAGETIGPYDLQIAAICLQHGLTLVTSNTAEFSRVAGLKLEDWDV